MAVEYDEFAGERLAASIANAERAVDALAERLAAAVGVSEREAA